MGVVFIVVGWDFGSLVIIYGCTVLLFIKYIQDLLNKSTLVYSMHRAGLPFKHKAAFGQPDLSPQRCVSSERSANANHHSGVGGKKHSGSFVFL